MAHNYTYQAFGKLETQWGGTENNYLFAGEQFDEGVGEYYLRDRFYDADTGRFLRRDIYEGMLEEPLTLHKYNYAHSNPINLIDPSGLIAVPNEGQAALIIFAILATIATVVLAQSITDKEICRYTIDEDHIFYPDTRFGGLTGFHSTALAFEGIHYEWVIEPPYTATYEPFSATYKLPERLSLSKRSSFFPTGISDTEVLMLIGEAYERSGCRAFGDWSSTVTSPTLGIPMRIQGYAVNHHITTAYPTVEV